MTQTRSPLLRVAALPVAALALLFGAVPAGLAVEAAPLVQQGAKLTAGTEESGAGRFGRAVALSADGDTALVGAPRDGENAGAAWVLTRSGTTWTVQAKLTAGAQESGAGRFGRSVALSADGDTALVGAPNDGGRGAAWVFTRSGTVWTAQAQLTGAGETGSGWFGASVALSADGQTAAVGGFNDHSTVGAVWMFARTGSTWTQGAKLTGGEEQGAGAFGWSVALDAAGDTALVGGRLDGAGTGAAWVFARSGSGADATWAQQGPKLTGGGEAGAGELGQSVALDAAGDTALVGGFHDGAGTGAAWVFARSGPGASATWAQQGVPLTGDGEAGAGYFGDAVALTPDGSTALVGGFEDDEDAGAAWVFARSGSGTSATWAQQGVKLTGGSEERGRGELGWSVALDAAGDTALVGGLGDDGRAGAAWVFVPPADSPPEGGGTPEGGAPAGGGTPGGQTPGTQPQTLAGGSPGASGTAHQGVAAYQASGGVVLVGRRLTVRGGRVQVRLRCTAATACRGRLTLTLAVRARAARRARTAVIAAHGFALRAGAVVTVVLPLGRSGRARLRAGRGRLAASLAVRVLAPDPVRAQVYAVRLVSSPARR